MYGVRRTLLNGGVRRVAAVRSRADERTRVADLVSLRVIYQALQGLAWDCKSRIPKRFPLLGVAQGCTVLRSRWYQSGVNQRLN